MQNINLLNLECVLLTNEGYKRIRHKEKSQEASSYM